MFRKDLAKCRGTFEQVISIGADRISDVAGKLGEIGDDASAKIKDAVPTFETFSVKAPLTLPNYSPLNLKGLPSFNGPSNPLSSMNLSKSTFDLPKKRVSVKRGSLFGRFVRANTKAAQTREHSNVVFKTDEEMPWATLND